VVSVIGGSVVEAGAGGNESDGEKRGEANTVGANKKRRRKDRES
jgi:hypothetical protein